MRAIVLGLVLLAAIPAFAGTSSARAEDRNECIRKYENFILDKGQTTANRLCDPKNFVSNPNEYGWVCDYDLHRIVRVKGHGAKQQRDALCGTE